MEEYFYQSGIYEMVIYSKNSNSHDIKLYKKASFLKVVNFFFENGIRKWNTANRLNRMCIAYRFPFQIEKESLRVITVKRRTR